MARPSLTARRAPRPWAVVSPSTSVVVLEESSTTVSMVSSAPAFCLATISSAARATCSALRSWVTSTCSTSTRVRGRA